MSATGLERARRLFANDGLMHHLGAELVDIQPGRAQLHLTVDERHTQGHGLCHGGTLFACADGAFAVACNSHDHAAVAQQCSINYLVPARVGDTLTVTVEERTLRGRSGVYDGEISREDGTLIAMFRGVSRSIREPT